MYSTLDLAEADQEVQKPGSNDISQKLITQKNRRVCYNHTIIDDDRLELDEWTGLSLTVKPNGAPTEVDISESAIQIVDDDSECSTLIVVNVFLSDFHLDI